MDKKTETKVVKTALAEAGYSGARVSHGSGTARCWLHVGVDVPRPYNCNCNGRTIGYCRNCGEAIQEASALAEAVVEKATGRHGEYNCISVEVFLRG